MKKTTFYSLLLIVITFSIQGFSKPISSDYFSANTNQGTFFSNPLNDYVSLRPDFEESFIESSASRAITSFPTDFSVNVDPGTCGAVVTYTMPTTNLSGGSMVLTSALGIGDTFPDGPTTVTYEERDSGNTATGQICNFVVTVLDNEAPVLTPGIDRNVNLDASCEITIPNVLGTATDNCDVASITQNPIAGFVISAVHNQTINVTVTATDDSGNTDVETVVLTAIDVINPITPTLANLTGECSVTATAPTTTDACSGTITGTTTDPLTYNTQGTYIIVWNFDDGNGNISTQTQNVVIDDLTAPTPDVATLANVTAQCEVTSLTPPTATDNCGGTVTVTNDATLPISTQGTTVVTWTYDDGNGNTSTQTQNVIIDDITAPTPDVATLADVTAQCEVTTLTAPTATDNCGGSVTITNDATLPITTQGTTVVTWTYDDGNGNTSTQTQNVIIDDITAPTPDVATLANVTAECEVTTLTPPTATDNCGGTVTVTNDATLPISTQGTTVVTWTYDDGNGNTSTQTQNVVIDDITAPTPDVATLADVTAQCEVTTLTAPTATDNCGGTVTVTNDATLPISTQGTTVVTWTYDDGNGNTSTQTQNVVIDDITAPTPDVATLANVTAQCEVTTLTAPTATDNCGGTVTVTNDATLPISTQGTTVVTWTYDDGNGNTSTQTQNVVIDDVTAPIADIATLANVTAECEVTTLTAPTATDNCGGTVTVSNDASLPISTQGTTVVTWTYDDGNGNTSTQTQNVVIDDITAPTPDVATLADVTAQCEVTTLTAPTATDNCGGTVTVTNDATLPISTQGTTVVTWTYDDGNGNTSTQTQNVVIYDLTAPTPDVATLADVTAQCEVTSLTPPNATDNCGGTVTVTNDATLPISTQGTTVVTWTYDDGNGNTSTQTQNVVIDDLTAPTPDVATLADVTAQCEVTTLTAPTATDNCGGTVTVTNDATLPISTQGTTVVTWTYDDGNGNTSTQTQNVVIDDVTAPIADIATLANVTAECEVATLTAPTATDNCGGTVTVTNDATLPISTQGTTVVTWTYTDANGNASTQTQNVVINDTVAPIFNACPPSASLNNDLGTCGAIATYPMPTASDTCGTVTITQTDTTGLTSGDVFPIGTTTIEFTADDGNGNTAICSFTVTVTDAENPTITCPSDIIVNADTNCEVTTVNLGTPTTTDNCGIASVSNDLAGQLPLPIGIHTITWTVEDSAGLTTTCTQQVTVQDVTPPVISCPTPNAFYNTDAGQCNATLTFIATASDNCSAAPLISYEVGGSPITFPYAFPVGTTTVDVIANDGNGLSSTCNFDVVVQDNEAPTAICQSISIPLDASGNASILASDIDGGSVDNCSTVTLNASQTTFTCANVGTNNVILTVTDAAGNVSTCNAVVTVLDPVQGATASISSSPGSPICNGTAVTFTATSSNLGASPNYEWFVGGSSVGNNNASYTTTSLTNGDDVYVEITSGPCNTVTTSNSITMTVNPLLPVSFTLNTSANPACTGENLTFFVTGLTNGGATPAYQWYVNGSPVGSNTNAFTSTTISTGDVVSVEVSSSLTCATPIPATESLTMTVTPDATINLTSGNDNQTVCNGNALNTITYNITNASGATISGIPSGITGSYSAGTFTISGSSTQVGTYNYTVTPNGCGNTIATGTIIIAPDASINLISASEDVGVCNDNSAMTPIEFQLNSGATGATLTSSPTLPSGITGSFNAATGIYTISGSTSQIGLYTYTLNTVGCGTGDAISGEIIVYNGVPVLPNSISGPSSFFCPVTEAIYSVPLDPNVETYNWNVSSGFTIQSGQGTNEVTLSVNGFAFLETISVTATNACGTSNTVSDTVIFNFTVNDIDAGPDLYVCAGTTSVTMNGNDGGLDYDEWTWSDNGAGGSFSTHYVGRTRSWSWGCFCWVYTNIYDYTETSTYTIPASAQPGDVITISLIADNWWWCDPLVSTMQIHILEAPEAEITSSDVTLCEGDSTTITFSGTPNAQIRYNDGSGNTQVQLNASGNYSLTVSPTVTTTYTLNRVRYTNGAYPGAGNNCDVTLNESVTINVNEPATVSAPADVTICEGETVSLASATIGGSNAVGTWTSSGSTGTISGSTYTPSPADIFNGSVTLTYTNTPSDGICPAMSDSMVVTINQLPTVDAGVNRTICSTETVTLNGSIGGTATSATWSAPSGSFSNPNDLNATYTPSISTGTVTLTLTSNDPAGPCGPDMDTVIITVNPAATVHAGPDQTICSNETVTLVGSFGGSASSATWGSNGTGTFSGSVYTPSTADITAGSVILTYTTNNPAGVCGIVSDSMLVTINQAASVNAGLDITTCSINATVNLVAVANTAGSWSGGSGTFADANSPNTTYTLGVGETSGTVTLTYTTIDPDGVEPCNSASDAMVITIVPYISATASNLTTIGSCSDTTIQLSANGSGQWSAVSIPTTSTYSFSNVNDPNATFTGESGVNYTLTWTIDNAAPCADDSATVAVNFPSCDDFIDFDGTDDSVNFGNVYNLSGSFSIEAWIKPSAISNSVKTIISKRDASNLSTGYDLRLVNGTVSFNANGSSITANGITASRWYHIAVTYNGTQYKLYVDGIDRNTRTGPIPSANNYNTLLGAMARSSNTPTNYYSGWMDELRIWNTSLSAAQIRQMMNQEIGNNGGAVHGSTVPLNVSGLTWSNLTAYYQMNQGTADISGGNLVANVGTNGRLRNMTTLQEESAPLPYISTQNGNWNSASTWLYGNVQMIPNTNAVTWNIVRTVHNVDSGNRATTVLGLLVDANTVTISNEQSLQVNSYLKIDGVLDLEGESQLLQPTGSIVDYTGTGSLHRDQQGTTNLFNYNYWTSPVSTDGASFKIGNVLYDGTNPVNWVPGPSATGSTNPVTLSSRWLYLYENYPADSYAAWNDIDTNYDVPVGLGFTMKGSGVGHPINDLQNYTFVGKPNNGTIITPVTGGNEALVGNPYPSAIDATQFINDNAGSITGALYFWEHSKTNNSHITIDYEGGYAVRNLLSGVAATSPPTGIGSVGMVGKIPERYVAVAQGFYVTGDSDGGNIIFNNAQRAFKKESEANTSVFFRNESDSEVHTGVENDNLFKLIRLDFSSPEGAVRHLALGFTPNNEASEAVDYGYDALNTDYFPSDMSFQIEDGKYIIQGVGEFNDQNMYPITIDMGMTGNAEIALTDLENFDEDPDVFVYDALLGTYTRINVTPYQTNLDAGTHEGRFYIVFQEDNVLSTETDEFPNVIVNYLNSTNQIYIKVPYSMDIKQVYLVNMLGQTIKSWNSTNAPLSQECKIPVRQLSEGNYIIKVQTTDNQTINKKVIVKMQ